MPGFKLSLLFGADKPFSNIQFLLLQTTKPMKISAISFTVVCLLFLLSTSGYAQRTIIKYAPLTSFGVERVLSDKKSIYGGVTIGSLGSFGIKGEYRFYGLIKSSPKVAPEGFWVAPTAAFGSIVFDEFDRERIFVAQAGGIAGYQWVFNKKISFEPALGIGATLIGGSSFLGGLGVVTPLFALRVGYVLN